MVSEEEKLERGPRVLERLFGIPLGPRDAPYGKEDWDERNDSPGYRLWWKDHD